MKEPVESFQVYSTQEAADLLGLNDATVQKLIREKRLEAVQIGRMYRVSGKAIMDFMNMLPNLYHQQTGKRSDLVFHLNEAIAKLIPIFRKTNQDLGVFLHQSINMHADERTLKDILIDVRKHIELEKNKKGE